MSIAGAPPAAGGVRTMVIETKGVPLEELQSRLALANGAATPRFVDA